MPALADMHCHLDFFPDPGAIADAAAARGIALLGVTCEPATYERVAPLVADAENVRLAAGLHPWWIAEGRAGADATEHLCELIGCTRYVGEVGLDFSDKHTPPESHGPQIAAFERIVRTAASAGGKLLSVHAVASASAALDILEAAGTLSSCDVIFHWFSGSTEELWRAIRAGAYFSVNPMMLATRRAREYVKLIPETRLLLETDLPPENPDAAFGAAKIEESLKRSLTLLATYLGRDVSASAAEASRLLLC